MAFLSFSLPSRRLGFQDRANSLHLLKTIAGLVLLIPFTIDYGGEAPVPPSLLGANSSSIAFWWWEFGSSFLGGVKYGGDFGRVAMEATADCLDDAGRRKAIVSDSFSGDPLSGAHRLFGGGVGLLLGSIWRWKRVSGLVQSCNFFGTSVAWWPDYGVWRTAAHAFGMAFPLDRVNVDWELPAVLEVDRLYSVSDGGDGALRQVGASGLSGWQAVRGFVRGQVLRFA